MPSPPKPEKLVPNLELRAFIDSQPCVYCANVHESLRRYGPRTHHHIRTRGSGGKDENNMIPVHWICHAIAHSVGFKRFEEGCGRDLKAYAVELTEMFKRGE